MSYSVSPSLLNRTASMGGDGFITIPQLNIIGSHLKSDEKTSHRGSIKRCCHIRISRLEFIADTSKDKLPTVIKFSIGINKIRRNIITTPIDLSTSLVEISSATGILNNSTGSSNNNINNNISGTGLEQQTGRSISPNQNLGNENRTLPIEIKSNILNNDNNPYITNSSNNVSSSPLSVSPITVKKSNQHDKSLSSKKMSYFYPMDIRISFHYDHSLKEYDDCIKITLLKSVSSKRPSSRDSHIPIAYCTINLSQILQQGEFAADIDLIPSGGDNIATSLNLLVVSVPKEIENIDEAQEYQLNDIALSDDDNLFLDSDSDDYDDDEDNISYHVSAKPNNFQPISNNNIVSNTNVNIAGTNSIVGNSLNQTNVNNNTNNTNNSNVVPNLTIPSNNSSFSITPPIQPGSSPNISFIPISGGSSLSNRLMDMMLVDQEYNKKKSTESKSKSKLQKLSSLIKPISGSGNKHHHHSNSNDNDYDNDYDHHSNNNNNNNNNSKHNNHNTLNNNIPHPNLQQIAEDYYSSSSESDIYESDEDDHHHHQQQQISEFSDDEPSNSPYYQASQAVNKTNEKSFVNTKSVMNTSSSNLLPNSNLLNGNTIVSSNLPPLGNNITTTVVNNSNSTSNSPLQVSSMVPPQNIPNIETFINILSDSESSGDVVLINGLRRKGKKLIQMLECCTSGKLKSMFNCIPTKSSSDINQILKTLLSKHVQGSEPIKIVIAGSDSYIHLILKAYVSLLSTKPRSWEPFSFYLLPLGKSNDIAYQIASQDPTYTSLFFSNEWKKVFFEKPNQEIPSSFFSNEQALEVENRILQYLGLFPSTSNQRYPFRFPIGEAIINLPANSNSIATPFIKGIQIENETNDLSPTGGTITNTSNVNSKDPNSNPSNINTNTSNDLQIDYWSPGKKKGEDHHTTIKTPFQIIKITRLSTVSTVLKIAPFNPPTSNTFNLFVLYKDKSSNKKKSNYLRFVKPKKESSSSTSNLTTDKNNSSSLVNSNNPSIRSKLNSSPSIMLVGSSSSNTGGSTLSGNNTIPSDSESEKPSKKEKEKEKEDANTFNSNITKFMCGPISSSSSSSSSPDSNLFKVMIDGYEFNGVKFLTVSPQWATHVKYFTIQTFINNPIINLE